MIKEGPERTKLLQRRESKSKKWRAKGRERENDR